MLAQQLKITYGIDKTYEPFQGDIAFNQLAGGQHGRFVWSRKMSNRSQLNSIYGALAFDTRQGNNNTVTETITPIHNVFFDLDIPVTAAIDNAITKLTEQWIAANITRTSTNGKFRYETGTHLKASSEFNSTINGIRQPNYNALDGWQAERLLKAGKSMHQLYFFWDPIIAIIDRIVQSYSSTPLSWAAFGSHKSATPENISESKETPKDLNVQKTPTASKGKYGLHLIYQMASNTQRTMRIREHIIQTLEKEFPSIFSMAVNNNDEKISWAQIVDREVYRANGGGSLRLPYQCKWIVCAGCKKLMKSFYRRKSWP